MKNEIKNILIILTPLVILAFFVGQRVTSDAAAVAVGVFLGLLGAGLFALIYVIVRDQRHRQERNEAARPPRQVGQVPPNPIIEGDWREVSSQPARQLEGAQPTPALPAPGDRAVVIYQPKGR